MLTFQEIYQSIEDKIQKSDSTFETKVKRWVNQRYESLMKMQPWKGVFDVDTSGVTYVTGSAYLILPKKVGHIFVITEMTNLRTLDPIDYIQLWRNSASTINSQDAPVRWADAGQVGSRISMTIADKIQVLSSSASDNSAYTVRVRGLVSGEEVSETITLNGTTAVDSTNTFDSGSFITAAKSSNNMAGTVTVREKTTTSNTLVTLGMNEFTAWYKRLRLHYVPNSAPTVAIAFNRKVPYMVNALDVPAFDCSMYLIEAGYAEALREQKQHDKARLHESVRVAMEYQNLLTAQSFDEQIQQFTPMVRQRF